MEPHFLDGKSVLVTGGTGSFGSAFVKRLLDLGACRRVIVFSRDEFKQHEMRLKLGMLADRVRFFLGDVRDLSRLERAFQNVDVVVHAAALKQVPALEYNPIEAVRTNVLGTQNVIDAALNNHVGRVILISTDKAVNPINLYGATKLCAEKLCITANAYRSKKELMGFGVVRYGNVIGSRGSIVDVLNDKRAIGPILLTHPEMTRFFITIDQGVDLVLNALALMRGGEIFIPKLPAMKIVDLIRALAPAREMRVTGIRPGEKLHEALLTEDELGRTRDAGSYYIVEPHHDWWEGGHLADRPRTPPGFEYASNRVGHITADHFLKIAL